MRSTTCCVPPQCATHRNHFPLARSPHQRRLPGTPRAAGHVCGHASRRTLQSRPPRRHFPTWGMCAYRILRVEQGKVRWRMRTGERHDTVLAWRSAGPVGRAFRALLHGSGLRSVSDAGRDGSGRSLADRRKWVCRRRGIQLAHYLAARTAWESAGTQRHAHFERSSMKQAGCNSSSTPLSAAAATGLGLALRKRFCRSFNFELQAAATEDHHHTVPHDCA